MLVYSVDPGSPDKAGIKAGELITEIDGKPTPDPAVLAAVLADLAPGQTVKVCRHLSATRVGDAANVTTFDDLPNARRAGPRASDVSPAPDPAPAGPSEPGCYHRPSPNSRHVRKRRGCRPDP